MRPLLAAVLLVLAACETLSNRTDWVTCAVVRRPPDRVIDVARDVVKRHGYSIEIEDPDTHRFETKWKATLGPHWRQGWREKVEVLLETRPDGALAVKLRTYREVNDDSWTGGSAANATWIPAGGDEDLAVRLKTIIGMELAKLD